jgi:hypothetical protein
MKHDANGKRELLEHRANVARERILQTLDAIDRKRHSVADAGERAREMGRRFALPVGVAVGATWVAVGVFAYAMNRRRMRMFQRSPRYWLARAVQPPKPSLFAETFKRVLTATLITVASEVARRVARRTFSHLELDA